MFAKLLARPFTRFLIVGGSAFVVEYLSFLGLYYWLGVWLVLANGLSFGLGLMTSFGLNRGWTFNYRDYKRPVQHQFVYYVLLAVFNLLATILLVNYFKRLDLVPKYGKLLAMIITSSWNFLLFKKVVFKHLSNDAE